MSVDQTALRRALRAGDVEQVVRLCDVVAHGVAAKYFAPGHEHQDLVQVARIGIAQAVPVWSGNGPFVGWASFCAERQVITVLKNARRHKHQVVNTARSLEAPAAPGAEGLSLGEVLPGTSDPLEQLLVAEELAAIEAAMPSLTSLERASVQLTHGLGYAELAQRLGVTTKAIDNASQRATRKLARYREEHHRAI